MKRIDSVNVIPFIDIMPVLLAIVLATATFIAEGRLDLELTHSETAAESGTESPPELAIVRTGGVFIDVAPVTPEASAKRLGELPPETAMALRVDSAAAFGRFVAVIDLPKANGPDRPSIGTRKP